ncbi:MAG: methylated-DNA--[protein]-cysteine S-methyltransferase [Patescibacteria group bacterium]
MNFFQRVYGIVALIPRGNVASYGQIAALAGNPRAARVVGWALHVMTPAQYQDIPWHRVINSRGMISTTCREHPASLQAALLRKEGIAVITRRDGSGWVDLKKYLWQPIVRSTKH